jgi:NTE family protein
MSKVISRYIALLREMHDIICNVQLDDKLADEKGTIIQQITRIERNEDVHFLFEDADFSVDTIKKLIKQGEKDTENILATN